MFTIAYLGRLQTWWFVATAVEGALVLASWWTWSRVTAQVATRHRSACVHLAALAVSPVLAVALLHWTAFHVDLPIAAAASPIAASNADALPRGPIVLTIAWALGFVAMLLGLVVDARRVERLHRRPASPGLVAIVVRLARDRMGIAAPRVAIADVASPQVVGSWRPTLLVPHDLARRLDDGELRAVLLHELAHLRRRDFGWNLSQRLVLAVLWFHPVAWMLQRRLAQEREACCDALAVRCGASATDLARALVRLAEPHAGSGPGLAMAVARGGALTERIHRLLGPTVASDASQGARLLAVAASIACATTLVAARSMPIDPALGDLCRASAFGPTIAIEARDAAGSFALRVRQGRVVDAAVEHRSLPVDRIVQDGERVVLMGAGREPIVALTVSPQGRIRWAAVSQKSASGNFPFRPARLRAARS